MGGAGITGYKGPPDAQVTMQALAPDGWTLASSIPDIRAGFDVEAVCDRCEAMVETSMKIYVSDLPLKRQGQWRHDCGGTALLPEHYTVTDRRTGASVDLYRGHRESITVSAITMAELLRLSQAARAVQGGRPGAEERLERVLAEAPEPIRRLRDRLALTGWTREQKMMLANIIVVLVAALLPLLKSDGAVTERQLVQIIDRLVDDHQSHPTSQQGQPKEDRTSGAGSTGAEQSGTPSDSPQRNGRGSPPEVQGSQPTGGPNQ